jgi:hypothetical protein
LGSSKKETPTDKLSGRFLLDGNESDYFFRYSAFPLRVTLYPFLSHPAFCLAADSGVLYSRFSLVAALAFAIIILPLKWHNYLSHTMITPVAEKCKLRASTISKGRSSTRKPPLLSRQQRRLCCEIKPAELCSFE